MSTLKANAVQTLAGKPILNSTGSIIQVAHGTLPTPFTGTSTGTPRFIEITGLSATITPTSSSNKILIFTNLYIGTTTAASGYQQHFRVLRNGSNTVIGTTDSNRPGVTGRVNMYGFNTYSMIMLSGSHYDSPASTSALTYTIAIGGYSGSPVMYVNRSENDQDTADYNTRPVSTITVMEVSA